MRPVSMPKQSTGRRQEPGQGPGRGLAWWDQRMDTQVVFCEPQGGNVAGRAGEEQGPCADGPAEGEWARREGGCLSLLGHWKGSGSFSEGTVKPLEDSEPKKVT